MRVYRASLPFPREPGAELWGSTIGDLSMFRNYGLLAVVIVGIGLAITLLIPHGKGISADPKPAPESLSGRYQVFKSQKIPDECLLDTATGKVWRLKADGVGELGQWVLAVEAPK